MKDKLLSGRFIFTVITAVVFAITALSGKLTPDKVTEIILIVVYAYFNKSNTPPTNGGTVK